MARLARKNVKSIEDIDKWLTSERKIRFNTPPKSKEDLLFKVMMKGTTTYYVRGSNHTDFGRSRSVHDLLLLFKFYYPTMTYFDIIEELIKYYCIKVKRGKPVNRIMYCPDIGKYNFRIYTYLSIINVRGTIISSLIRDVKTLFINIKVNEEDLHNKFASFIDE
jgi:hypothetical protein